MTQQTGRGAMENFLISIPRVTRFWFLATLAMSLLGRINRKYLIYFMMEPSFVFNNYEVNY